MSWVRSFVAGAVVGGVLVWIYGREIREYVDEKTRGARTRAAERLGAAAESLVAAKERIEAKP
ncbi:MAG: hypothetical protein A3F92_11590 [Candidatus Rokubacteria bacterium RIFCSPLOWO2_12_FULL_71_22]|nr:MAG: hypothetical protein A3F92_11590 [Candidatus Rokubacteria bacterium RIFCSPLOWO2_12_FULL_71_22]